MFLITHGTEWPVLCWCAVKQLLTHSLSLLKASWELPAYGSAWSTPNRRSASPASRSAGFSRRRWRRDRRSCDGGISRLRQVQQQEERTCVLSGPGRATRREFCLHISVAMVLVSSSAILIFRYQSCLRRCRVCKGVAGLQWSSAEGALVETPKAPRGVGCGKGVSPENCLLFDLKVEHFGAVFKLDLTDETRTQLQLPHLASYWLRLCNVHVWYVLYMIYTVSHKNVSLYFGL